MYRAVESPIRIVLVEDVVSAFPEDSFRLDRSSSWSAQDNDMLDGTDQMLVPDGADQRRSASIQSSIVPIV